MSELPHPWIRVALEEKGPEASVRDAFAIGEARIVELEAECARLRKEVKRQQAWLSRIDGGDEPCDDAAQLRQWAYEANTLGWETNDE